MKSARAFAMNPTRRFLAVCLVGAGLPASAQVVSTLEVYPLGAGDSPSATFKLAVDSLAVPVLAYSPLYDYAHFSARGPVQVSLAVPEPVRTWQISPLARNISAHVDGSRLTFILPQATYVIVKINELKELALAADAPEPSVPPSSGPEIYNVTAAPYAADATGRTLVTATLQQAIDDAHAAGGGTVYFPVGTYLSGSLCLRSNVSLYLAGGAFLRSSGDPADFTADFYKQSLRMPGAWFLYTAAGSENIRIFGRGTIDGNARELRGRHHFLNNLVVPLQTSHFTLEGVVLRDSGLWGLIPVRSDHIVIRDTKHFNEADKFYEDDAVDIIECQEVLVSHTLAISEDDTYSTKTWSEQTDIAAHWPGSPEPLEQVVFEDCLARSRCAAFKVGFGCFQPQRDIVFRNSCAYRCMRAIAINRQWGAAPVENVTFADIDVEGFDPRVRDRSLCRWLDLTTGPGGAVVNTVLRQITVREPGPNPSRIEGNGPAARIDGLRLENVVVRGVRASSLAALDVGPPNRFVTGVAFVDKEAR